LANLRIFGLEQEFPIKSTLDPAQFGDPVSAITAKDIEAGLEGLTVEQVGLLRGFGFWVVSVEFLW
jgi:hypothetical protein